MFRINLFFCLFFCAFAYILAVEKSRIVKTIIIIGLIGLTIWNGVTLWDKSYSAENNKPIEGYILCHTSL